MREQMGILEHLRQGYKSNSSELLNYWINYSHLGTWQFWLCAAILIVPLIVVYLYIDRGKAFHIGFFGFNVHTWFSHIDTYGVLHGLWEYPYQVIPFTPVSFMLDVSLVPVSYMLVYQWAINHGRSRYLFLTLLSAGFAFVFKPIMTSIGLFKLHEWMNYLLLFCGYMVIMLVSVWITVFFQRLQQTSPPKFLRK
ncbi:hypothetical protein DNH61_09945 [Paenibacillus sambharensis]|uniref:Uncharacterized protein n=1 Tax=Paenibacillus sambharensis TaxID=1803190 RepID=A0A2W1LCG8_9BACL|nr:CBO0543 family protein [Paenibacillus sambharensis]PZD95770.1 hypothetical protein DNH61_09945 [Paenibacillus sambharensis]